DFLTRYLRQFETTRPTRLRRVSATCPPDYSEKARGEVKEIYKRIGKADDAVFKVDEASGAAVYYVYNELKKRNFDVGQFIAPYNNEEHNLLVFDLGGGTTDISLVKVSVVRDRGRAAEIDLKVLATASLLNIGGDNFTLAVLKSLKCHI